MADEYLQPQLHRHHDQTEEEGSNIESFDNSKNFTGFATANADVATTDMKLDGTNVVVGDETAVEARDRGLFGKENPDEDVNEGATEFEKVNTDVAITDMKDELEKERTMSDTTEIVGDETAKEAKDRGLFGNFMGKKKPEEVEVDEVATEFEKVNVSPEEKKEEKELQRSHSTSSSSSSDEEDGVEGEKMKKKKGMKDKIKDMVSGGNEKAEEKAEIETNDKEVEAAYVEPTEAAYVDAASDQTDGKTGFVDEMKEKTRDTEDAPTPPPSKAEEADTKESETKEKKGIFEKIKEKIPGYNQTKPADN